MLSVGRELNSRRSEPNSHGGVCRLKTVGLSKISTAASDELPATAWAAGLVTAGHVSNLDNQTRNNLTNPSFRMRQSCACALMLVRKTRRRSDDRRNG